VSECILDAGHARRTSVLEMNFVLDVEIGSPVADLSRTVKADDGNNCLVVVVLNENRSLVLCLELL